MRRTNKTRIIIDILINVVIVAVILTIASHYFAKRYIQSLQRTGWPQGAYRLNSTMGFEMSPGFSATMLDGRFSIHTHQLGYRIPKFLNNSSITPGGVLSVGCSFTYGDSVEAEQTFSYLVADKLHLPSYNYGVCSYSYATVILQLKELKEKGILDQLKPSILILGAGKWLSSRSMSPIMPMSPGYVLLSPYIGKESGRVQIVSPPQLFSNECVLGSYEDYFFDQQIGLTKKGFYLLSHYFPRLLYAKFATLLGSRQPPVSSYELYDYVITEIKKVIAPYGMKFVILWMPFDIQETLDEGLAKAMAKHDDIILVDGSDAIAKYQVRPFDYRHRHPSPIAHDAYAKEIVNRIMNKETLHPSLQEIGPLDFAVTGENHPAVYFFPVAQARWNGYKISNKNWNQLADDQKAVFISEGIGEIERNANVTVKSVKNLEVISAMNQAVVKLENDFPGTEMSMMKMLVNMLKSSKRIFENAK